MYATFRAYRVVLDLFILIIFGVMKLLLLQPAIVLFLFSPYVLSILFSVQHWKEKRQHRYARDLSYSEMH
jgi:hypothetical protein